jgi:hypothetical protein
MLGPLSGSGNAADSWLMTIAPPSRTICSRIPTPTSQSGIGRVVFIKLQLISLLDGAGLSGDRQVAVGGFSGLFEIAFGLGAVFYYLEIGAALKKQREKVMPLLKERLNRKWRDIWNFRGSALAEIAFGFLLGVLVAAVTASYIAALLAAFAPTLLPMVILLIFMTFIFSAITTTVVSSLGLLVVGFYPELEVSTNLMMVIAGLAFAFPIHVLLAQLLRWYLMADPAKDAIAKKATEVTKGEAEADLNCQIENLWRTSGLLILLRDFVRSQPEPPAR